MRIFPIVTVLALVGCTNAPVNSAYPAPLRDWRPNIDGALAAHYPALLAGEALPDSARAIWFISDQRGRLLDHGTRAALPDTVAFKALTDLVPAIGGLTPEQFELSYAGRSEPAASVAVLYIVVR